MSDEVDEEDDGLMPVHVKGVDGDENLRGYARLRWLRPQSLTGQRCAKSASKFEGTCARRRSIMCARRRTKEIEMASLTIALASTQVTGAKTYNGSDQDIADLLSSASATLSASLPPNPTNGQVSALADNTLTSWKAQVQAFQTPAAVVPATIGRVNRCSIAAAPLLQNH